MFSYQNKVNIFNHFFKIYLIENEKNDNILLTIQIIKSEYPKLVE